MSDEKKGAGGRPTALVEGGKSTQLCLCEALPKWNHSTSRDVTKAKQTLISLKMCCFYFKIVVFYENGQIYKKLSIFYKKLPIVIYKKLNFWEEYTPLLCHHVYLSFFHHQLLPCVSKFKWLPSHTCTRFQSNWSDMQHLRYVLLCYILDQEGESKLSNVVEEYKVSFQSDFR